MTAAGSRPGPSCSRPPGRAPPRHELEAQLVAAAHRMHAAGWVANHDGNITVRLDADRWLATPSGVSKAAVERTSLIVVDSRGERVSGAGKPFGEMPLHMVIYRHRPDVRVVLHAHPPTATGLAVAGIAVRPAMLAEPVVSLGRQIPLVRYAAPKSPEATAHLLPFLPDHDAVVLECHGVMTWGSDLETALLRMELVEHLARIQLVALQAGGVRELPPSDIDALLEARCRAGLGACGRQLPTSDS